MWRMTFGWFNDPICGGDYFDETLISGPEFPNGRNADVENL